MKDCGSEVNVASSLPDFARNAHGNLAEQNRMVGAQHGADTTRPESKFGAPAAAPAKPAEPKAGTGGSAEMKAVNAVLNKYACIACHAVDRRILGPAFVEVAKKYPGKVEYLAQKIKSGGVGVWGQVPMPAQTLSEAEALAVANWIAAGASK
jgi:cytochrome c